MPETAYPLMLLLLFPCLAALWFVYRRSRNKAMLFSGAPYTASGKSWRLAAATIAPAIFVIGIMLAVTALSRPRTVFSKSQRTVDAVGVMMVVDVSGSMEALDMSTKSPAGQWNYRTRLEAVKETFQEFIAQRPDDLIGLIVFGGYASTLAPLTADHNVILKVLEGVEIPRTGDSEEALTAIGDALATASARLQNTELKSRIVVFLSDGVNNAGITRPEDATAAAKKLGLRVYTIGVGSSGRVPYWMRDVLGRKTIGYAQAELDEELLKKIANETGGQYFHVKDAEGLQKAVEGINKLEKTTVTTDVIYRYNELFFWFLLPAVLLILTASAVNLFITGRLV